MFTSVKYYGNILVMKKVKYFICPACKEKSFIEMRKEYDGFTVAAEKQVCALCGYEFKKEEQIEYVKEKQLFNDDEKENKFCRDCRYYVVHPWTQKCTLTKKEVTALDTCPRFVRR